MNEQLQKNQLSENQISLINQQQKSLNKISKFINLVNNNIKRDINISSNNNQEQKLNNSSIMNDSEESILSINFNSKLGNLEHDEQQINDNNYSVFNNNLNENEQLTKFLLKGMIQYNYGSRKISNKQYQNFKYNNFLQLYQSKEKSKYKYINTQLFKNEEKNDEKLIKLKNKQNLLSYVKLQLDTKVNSMKNKNQYEIYKNNYTVQNNNDNENNQLLPKINFKNENIITNENSSNKNLNIEIKSHLNNNQFNNNSQPNLSHRTKIKSKRSHSDDLTEQVDLQQSTESNSVPTVIITSEDNILQVNDLFRDHIHLERNSKFKKYFRDYIYIKSKEDYLNLLNESILAKTINNYSKNQLNFLLGDEYWRMDVRIVIQPLNQSNLFMVYIIEKYEDKDIPWQIIDPHNLFQLSWSIFTGLILFQIMWQVSCEIGFIRIFDPYYYGYEVFLENSITVFFAIDIIVNFFVAHEDEQGIFSYDIYVISYGYVTSIWFYADLISTIPFNNLLTSFPINTQSIKIFKNFKILKLIRLTKAFTFQNVNYLFQSEIGAEVMGYIKRNLGQLELFKSMMFMILMTHFYTCAHFYLKTNVIEGGDLSWLIEYQNQDQTERSHQEVYFKLLSENLKTALGLAVTNPPGSNLEILIIISWMIIGLSMFGQGIGNISSQINQSNKRENEEQETINFYKDLIVENDCEDEELVNTINKEIDIYQHNYHLNMFNSMAHILSLATRRKLEFKLYNKFIKSLPIFEKLSFDVVKKLKQCKMSTNTIVWREDEVVNTLQFVLKGCIKKSQNFKLTEEYYRGDILAMDNFIRQMQLKQNNIDFNLVFSNVDESELKFPMNLKFKMMKKILDHITSNKSSNMTQIKELRHKDSATAQEDAEQIEISFSSMEEVLKMDLESFKKIQLHWKDRCSEITILERQQSEKDYDEFKHQDKPGLMIKENEVQMINQSLDSLLAQNEDIDLDQLQLKYQNNLDSENQQNELIQKSMSWKIKIASCRNVLIVRDDNSLYCNLKRSMLEIKIVLFDFDGVEENNNNELALRYY